MGMVHGSRSLFELALATPVVLWGGWPFFQRGWASIVNRSLNMGLHLLIQAADDLAEWAVNVLRILNGICQGCSINPQELDVGARNEIAGQFAQNEAASHSGNRLVNTLDHPACGQPFREGAVVFLQDIGSKSARRGDYP